MNWNTPDLTQHPPRSARARLGGYVILPRMLDKGRATLAGKNGDFKFACPLDQQFLDFAGVDAERIKNQLAAGKTDHEILQWINANSTTRRGPHEIAAWTAYQERRAPSEPEVREFYNELHSQAAGHRDDISTWFDLLDVDDFVSYGGKA